MTVMEKLVLYSRKSEKHLLSTATKRILVDSKLLVYSFCIVSEGRKGHIDERWRGEITLLCEHLNLAGYRTLVAEEDADLLIVKTALNQEIDRTVFIVGNDTDLLVLLNQYSSNKNIFFKKPDAANKNNFTLYSSKSFMIPDYIDIIGLLYVFSGCDTTSSFLNQGKLKFAKSSFNVDDARVFYKADASEDEKYEKKTGKKLSLNELRCLHYDLKINNISFKLENLPPTEGAALQHSLRSYFQIQVWMGNNELDPTMFGWKNEGGILLPVYTNDELVPLDVLVHISCKCQRNAWQIATAAAVNMA